MKTYLVHIKNEVELANMAQNKAQFVGQPIAMALVASAEEVTDKGYLVDMYGTRDLEAISEEVGSQKSVLVEANSEREAYFSAISA